MLRRATKPRLVAAYLFAFLLIHQYGLKPCGGYKSARMVRTLSAPAPATVASVSAAAISATAMASSTGPSATSRAAISTTISAVCMLGFDPVEIGLFAFSKLGPSFNGHGRRTGN